MNILVLYQSPWWNAAAYYTHNVVKALINNDHNVFFACSKDSPAEKKINELKVKTEDINLLAKSPLTIINNIRKTNSLIDEFNIDLIIPITAQGHIISGIIRKFYNRKIPVIKVCLDNVPPVNNIFNKYLHHNLTDYFIFPGLATKARYDKIFTIDNYKIEHAPLDFEDFINFSSHENFKEKHKIPSNKIIVSFIGRFAPEKGIFFLLEIIAKTLNKSKNIFFILSGKESLIKFTEVNDRLNEYNIQNNVMILPKMDDVRELISITDIGILSSRYSEYICRIALEFMALKKPVVAPNLNVIPEVVLNKETGYIYEFEDSLMAANYIVNLAENSEMRNQMGINSMKRLEQNYTLKKFSEELESTINKVTEN